MNINLKQPKYVLPIILLPFFCLFFYVWHHGSEKKDNAVTENNGLNPAVAQVSPEVRKRKLDDKLDAYRNSFKEADGLSAVNSISTDALHPSSVAIQKNNAEAQNRKLDSIDRAMHERFNAKPPPVSDVAIARRLNNITPSRENFSHANGPDRKETDPMDMFKQQLAYMDSIQKQNDPAYKTEKLKKDAADKLIREKENHVKLNVTRIGAGSTDFNTVMPDKTDFFLNAVVDEDITGFAGSRLRLRLLDDIYAGKFLIPKGTFLYAEINGFSGQRVTLKVTSILSGGKILPVKLDVYDLDGLPGLYVPASAFRDFTKDLGSNSVQGISIDNASGSFVMSTVGRMFQSTSSAIAEMIRKNKAKLKFNTYVYLIDSDALHNAQKNY